MVSIAGPNSHGGRHFVSNQYNWIMKYMRHAYKTITITRQYMKLAGVLIPMLGKDHVASFETTAQYPTQWFQCGNLTRLLNTFWIPSSIVTKWNNGVLNHSQNVLLSLVYNKVQFRGSSSVYRDDLLDICNINMQSKNIRFIMEVIVIVRYKQCSLTYIQIYLSSNKLWSWPPFVMHVVSATVRWRVVQESLTKELASHWNWQIHQISPEMCLR